MPMMRNKSNDYNAVDGVPIRITFEQYKGYLGVNMVMPTYNQRKGKYFADVAVKSTSAGDYAFYRVYAATSQAVIDAVKTIPGAKPLSLNEITNTLTGSKVDVEALIKKLTLDLSQYDTNMISKLGPREREVAVKSQQLLQRMIGEYQKNLIKLQETLNNVSAVSPPATAVQ